MKRWIALSGLLSVLLFTQSALSQTPPPPTSPSAPPPATPVAPLAAPTAEPLPPPPSAADVQPPAPTPAPPAGDSIATPPTAPANTAVVTADNVNVRGQPSLNSEVVAKLTRGDRVVVLEDLPNPGKSLAWTKIALPEGTFVWVHSGYIDPGTKAVKPTRLNVRSGPGENYSVLGRLNQGTIVRGFETKGVWLKVAPPADTYAFLASYLIGRASPPAPESTPESTPAPAPATPEVAAVPAPRPVAEPDPGKDTAPATAALTDPEPPTPAVEEPLEVAAVADPAAPTESELPPALEPIEPIEPPELEVPPPPGPIEPEPGQLVKRIVSREGIVRRSVSIQAPTEFSLQNEENKKTINYLLPPPSKAIVLRGFEGQRILVTGEELIDVRWPKTPVLNIDSIRTRP